jgi:hypothetical protein
MYFLRLTINNVEKVTPNGVLHLTNNQQKRANMKKLFVTISAGTFGIIMMANVTMADSWHFATLPADGVINGAIGETIGWGYTITNEDPTNWLVISGLSGGSFMNGTPDASIFDYPILAPGTEINVPYTATTGLYGLTWDLSAPAGFTNAGTFVMSAEFWQGDPFVDGYFLVAGIDKSTSYAATVVDNNTNPVPVPPSCLMLITGLAGLVSIRKRKV